METVYQSENIQIEEFDWREISPEKREERFRKTLRNLLEDYKGRGKLLIELSQNSDDSINHDNGKIIITIDDINQQIIIYDNGKGMSTNDIKNYIPPQSTSKDNGEYKGNKGVGMTFVIAKTNFFKIETSNGVQYSEGIIENLNYYINNNSIPFPKLNIISKVDNQPSFTKITLGKIVFDEGEDIFEKSIDEIALILRTLSCIGNTNALTSHIQKPIEVILERINLDKKVENQKIIYGFPVLHSFLPGTLTIQEAENLTLQLKSIHGHALFKTGKVKFKERELTYYALCATSDHWKIVRKNLCPNMDDKIVKQYICPRLFVSRNGQPVPMTISDSNMFNSLAFGSLMFVLLEDNFAILNTGKELTDSKDYYDIIKNKIWKSTFEKYEQIVQINAHIDEDSYNEEIREIIALEEQIKNSPDLKLINFSSNVKKIPNSEQMVIQLFHECNGGGFFSPSYEILHGSSFKRYDEKWFATSLLDNKKRMVTAEYKFKAEDILKDMKKNIKILQNVDFLVCWTINKSAFEKAQFQVYEYNEDVNNNKRYSKVNYIITAPGNKKQTYVICLEKYNKNDKVNE